MGSVPRSGRFPGRGNGHFIYIYICIYLYVYIHIDIYNVFFCYSSVDGHLGCCHVLGIVNSAAMNIGVNVSFQIRVFSGYLPRSGISGSYGNSTFSFLRNLHTGLYSGCTSLHSHQQDRRIPLSLHSLQHLLFANFLNDGHIDQCEVTPPCSFDFSLIISDVEYIFMCLLTISMSSLDKHLFRSSARFLIGLFLLLLSCINICVFW